MAEHPILRRYTNLVETIHLLKTKKIALVDPRTWDDRNDVFYLTQYSEFVGDPVAALCFCQGSERYHHWRVFASGVGGVCIEFHGDWLIHELTSVHEELLGNEVTYRRFAAVLRERPNMWELPFLKRNGYRDEKEYRIIRLWLLADDWGEDGMLVRHKRDEKRQYSIRLGCIKRIVLNPWMPEPFRTSVTETLRAIEGCENLRVTQSRLINSEAWKRYAVKARQREEKLNEAPAWVVEDMRLRG